LGKEKGTQQTQLNFHPAAQENKTEKEEMNNGKEEARGAPKLPKAVAPKTKSKTSSEENDAQEKGKITAHFQPKAKRNAMKMAIAALHKIYAAKEKEIDARATRTPAPKRRRVRTTPDEDGFLPAGELSAKARRNDNRAQRLVARRIEIAEAARASQEKELVRQSKKFVSAAPRTARILGERLHQDAALTANTPERNRAFPNGVVTPHMRRLSRRYLDQSPASAPRLQVEWYLSAERAVKERRKRFKRLRQPAFVSDGEEIKENDLFAPASTPVRINHDEMKSSPKRTALSLPYDFSEEIFAASGAAVFERLLGQKRAREEIETRLPRSPQPLEIVGEIVSHM
jgi:hypothetical protein